MSDEEQAMDEGEAPAEDAEGAEEPGEEAGDEPGEEAGEEAGEGAADEAGGEAAAEAEDEDEGPFENMLEPLGDTGKYVVRQRQRLKTVARADAFVLQLLEKVEELRALGETLVLEDFDISENRLPADQLEGIVSALSDGDVHVERFRAFGCPTFDDQAATLLAGWLAGVTSETAPFEIHLSDCAITAAGFRDLMKALEENDAFPAPDPRNPSSGKKLPLYLRLEHNYIEDAAMKEVVDSGVAMKMKKKEPIRYSSDAKVRLLVREDGGFNQKKGDPPAPEDVPAPRPYHGKGKGKGKSFGKGGKGASSKSGSWSTSAGSTWSRSQEPWRGSGDSRRSGGSSWGSGTRSLTSYTERGYAGGRDAKPPWQALPAPAKTTTRSFASSRGSTWDRSSRGGGDTDRRPSAIGGYSSGAARGVAASSGAAWKRSSEGYDAGGAGGRASSNGSAPYNAFAAKSTPPAGDRKGDGRRPLAPKRTVGRGDDDEAAKRQRMSSGKGGGAAGCVGPGARPGGGRLPHPWEEHWSEEYKLNYYWNSKTGESSWDRPTGTRSRPGKH